MLLLLFGTIATGCSDSSSRPPAPDAAVDAALEGDVSDAAADAAVDAAVVDPAALCAIECAAGEPLPADATCFGDELTDGFGRLDGTVLAVQRPSDTECAMPNDDHLIVQVLAHGAAYRIVVNVLSDGRNGTDTRLRFADVPAPLPTPPWAEGWHREVTLDYVDTLGLHTTDFAPLATDALMDEVTARLSIGAPVSAYATSRDRPESAHLVHRNGDGEDGAIVVDPSGDARFLVFHFDGQEF